MLTLSYLQPGAAPNSVAFYYGTLAVFYGVYFILFWPLMSPLENAVVVLAKLPLHWSFYKVCDWVGGTAPFCRIPWRLEGSDASLTALR
jgi:hypothetical protein